MWGGVFFWYLLGRSSVCNFRVGWRLGAVEFCRVGKEIVL